MQKIISDYEGPFNKTTKKLSFKYESILTYKRFWGVFKHILNVKYTEDDIKELIVKKYKLPNYVVERYY